MATTTALHLRRNEAGRLRVVGDPPARHQVTADQFARFVAAGHVGSDGVELDRAGGGDPVRYRVEIDRDDDGEETGLIWLVLAGAAVEEG